MKISFLPMTPEGVARAWDDYRDSGLTDGGTLPFADLSPAQQRAEIERAVPYRRLVAVEDEIVGWIGIRPREAEKQIHVGFALFAPYRGKGLMKPILNARLRQFIQNEYALELGARFPEREILATVEPGNLPSIRTLEGCGFVKTDLEPVPKGFEGVVYRKKF